MKLYFNDSEDAIDIQAYNHSINFTNLRNEYYSIILDSNENINEIADTYDNIQITSLLIKDN